MRMDTVSKLIWEVTAANRESEDLPPTYLFIVFGEKTGSLVSLQRDGLFVFLLHRPMFRTILLSLVVCSAVYGQQDTLSHTLQPAEVVASKRNFQTSFLHAQQLDTGCIAKITARSLAERLDREAGMFIKSYGSAGIATLSLRGSGAAQSAIVWEGLTLNSPMLGLTDLNLIPAFLTDEINITYGGNGPLSGNGAVGGTISMSNPLSTAAGLKIDALAGGGSFGLQREGIGVKWGNGKITTQTKIYSEQSANDFSYVRPDGSVTHQSHAGTSQLGITQDLRFGKANRFAEVHGWYLKNKREIPALMISEYSSQEQEDENFRAALHLNSLHARSFIKLHTGFSHEYIYYRDPAVRLDEKSKAITMQSELEGGLIFGTYWRLIAQAGYQYATAAVESYSATASQQQWSLAGNLLFEKENIKAQGAIRQSIFNNDLIPPLPSASISLLLNRYITIRGDAAGVYRLPTLNDRFWQPGGNSDLSPEKGFSSAAGFVVHSKRKKINAEIIGNFFLSRLKDAIVWLPGDDGIYTAGNIQVLDSKGVEGRAAIDGNFGNWKMAFSGAATFTNAVISETDAPDAAASGLQLIYTPRILWKGSLHLGYKKFSIRYDHTYTGHRYVTTDHSHFLIPFDVAQCTLSWEHNFGEHRLLLTASVKNIYDEHYQVIAWRAMPGRSFEAGLFYTFGQR